MYLPNNTFLQGGKYKIIRFINSGGFGCTYEAEHVMLEMRVAIKEFFIKDFCNRDEKTAHVTVGTQSKKGLVDKLRRKFIEEAKALFRLQHPGIVRVTDVFEENGTAYFVMDYIEGHSLSEIVKQEGPLPEARALKYIRQVADALQYVHEHNRLHLDIKPGNIMINGQDNAILIDFGASKQYDEEDGENTSTLLGKTPGYAPLEQIGNDVVKFMPATDIYALGATLYKLLSGVTPLSANLLASGEELVPLSTGISESMRKAVTSAMQINKKKRPQTIPEFISMFDELPLQDSNSDSEITILSAEPNQESGNNAHTINGHEYVDLGLSVKWATCNIGSKRPYDYGDYFAWGETGTKIIYEKENCKTFNEEIGNIAGTPYDTATLHWGGTWRIPTVEEMQELIENCKWHFISKEEEFCKGFQVTGPNGNSIFLPAAGCRHERVSQNSVGEAGNYWTSTPNPNSFRHTYQLYFYLPKSKMLHDFYKLNTDLNLNIDPYGIKDQDYYKIISGYRFYGMSIRAVSK